MGNVWDANYTDTANSPIFTGKFLSESVILDGITASGGATLFYFIDPVVSELDGLICWGKL